MKKYLLLFAVLLVILFTYILVIQKQTTKYSVQKPKLKKITKNEIIQKKSEYKIDSIINVNQELKKKYGGEYMIGFNEKKTILTLLDYKGLFNPFIENLENVFSQYIKEIDTNKVSYMKKNSIINLNYYKNERNGNLEKYISGILLDSHIQFKNNIQIGMSKKEFLKKFFVLNNREIENLKQISVVQDERGELNTQYRFNKGKLFAISFGNYDEYKLLNLGNLSIPNWLTDLNSNINNEITQNILVYKQNDSISYTIVEQVSNVGTEIFLTTYKRKNKISSIKLSSNIDADLGMSEYSYSDFKIENNCYVITKITETAIDSVNQIKNGKALDEIETKIDTITKVYEISLNGKIELKK